MFNLSNFDVLKHLFYQKLWRLLYFFVTLHPQNSFWLEKLYNKVKTNKIVFLKHLDNEKNRNDDGCCSFFCTGNDCSDSTGK